MDGERGESGTIPETRTCGVGGNQMYRAGYPTIAVFRILMGVGPANVRPGHSNSSESLEAKTKPMLEGAAPRVSPV